MASQNNEGINNIESVLFDHRPGKIVISNSNAKKATAMIISDEGIVFTNSVNSGGLVIDNNGNSFQGVTGFGSKAENIRKAEFSENYRSSKIFTYTETVLMESVPKELMSEVVGKTGNNLSVGMDGAVPLITDISAGPLPHMHTISMKHVHRLEPAYLYRVPSFINIFKGSLDQLKQFFSI